MIKVHKICLDPNVEQKIYFAKACGVARFAFNWALQEWESQYKSGEKPSEVKLRKQFNEVKRVDFPWCLEVTKCAVQQAIKNLGTAYTNAFRRAKTNTTTGSAKNQYGFPKRKKKYINDKFRADNGPVKAGVSAVKVDGKKIQLPKVGWIKMREEVRFSGWIKSVTVSRCADKWFASIAVETEDVSHSRKNNKYVGIDLGVKNLVTLSDGTTYEGAKSLNKLLKKKRRLNKSLSRKKRGSNNRQKARFLLAKLEKKITDIRKDILHKITTKLALNNIIIAMEDLNIKGMLRNHRLARHLSDQAFGEFKRQLQYKSEWYKAKLLFVNKFFLQAKNVQTVEI